METELKARYLQVTFRSGKPMAAYLYLPRDPGEKSRRTEKAGKGILIDYGRAGRPIGIEITAPGHITLNDLNEVLARLNVQPVTAQELSPLVAA
jgi:uncharacterized protein YuzE